MIAIPNMEKPKDCKECQWHLDFCIEDEQVGGLCTITEKDDKENTCPLIEIDDTVWENEKYKLIRMTNEARINKAMAERRSDEGVKKKITKEDIKRLIDDIEYLKRLLGE